MRWPAQNASTPDWNDTNMVAEVEKRLGIRMECTSYEADIWSTQLTLMIASDDLPDLIMNPGLSLNDVATYGAPGVFSGYVGVH